MPPHRARPGFWSSAAATIVGEWYKEGDRTTAFNIYSSSKSYTSTAYGLILSDFGNGPLPGGKSLSLDTKVCNAEWLPESLPLPDPRKAEITVRQPAEHGLRPGCAEPAGEGSPVRVGARPRRRARRWPRSRTTRATAFHYSNAGVAHLVLVFHRATGEDLYPFLKRRLFDPIGETQFRWKPLGGPEGGAGAIGPFSQGYSGIHTNPRQHARFCYLAMHKGEWAGKRIVPASYYDFAWKGTSVKPDYGGQWWTAPHIPGAPADLVMTLGRNHNDGFVVPSLDLVFVRLGNGDQLPRGLRERPGSQGPGRGDQIAGTPDDRWRLASISLIGGLAVAAIAWLWLIVRASREGVGLGPGHACRCRRWACCSPCAMPSVRSGRWSSSSSASSPRRPRRSTPWRRPSNLRGHRRRVGGPGRWRMWSRRSGARRRTSGWRAGPCTCNSGAWPWQRRPGSG